MRIVRLHAKFLVFVLGSLLLMLSVLSAIMVIREAAHLKREAEEKQRFLAFTVFSSLKDNMTKGTPRSTLNLMNSLRGKHGIVLIETIRNDGNRAFGAPGKPVKIAQLAQVFNSGEEFSFREKNDPLLHTFLYPLKNDRDCIGCHSKEKPTLGVLLISLSLEESLREASVSTWRFTTLLAILILTIGGVLYFLVRRFVLRPLSVVHQGAERIGRGDLSHRIALSTNDEIQDLGLSLNVMAERLEASYAGLELRIRERTTEVEEKAKRLYQYSRDMAALSRLSTKVFNAEQSLDELLDRLMGAVNRGLGFPEALLFLVDRVRTTIELKRDSGLGSLLDIPSQPLASSDPFATLVRAGRELLIQDVSRDPLFSNHVRNGRAAGRSLLVIPILSGTRDKRCWEAKNCIRQGCPAYKQEDSRCWLMPETLCGNGLVQSYDDKLAYCMSCGVFPLLGVLLAAVPVGRAVRRSNMSVLRILAAEMGAALENHRLHNDNRQLLKELIQMHIATAAALAELSLDQALESFTDSVLKFPGIDACNFWLCSDDGQELRHKAGGCPGNAPEKDCPPLLPLDQGILAQAFRENRIIVEYNVPSRDKTPLGATAAAYGIPAVLAVPLTNQRRPIGVLSIHKKSTTPFPESQIAALMLLANHAAMAINVCILNDELKAQNKELANSTNLMGGILSSMTSGIMLLDHDGRVELINRAGAELLHGRADDIMGRLFQDCAEDPGALLTVSPGAYYEETSITRLDGSTLPVGFSITYFQGKTAGQEGRIVVFRDLTEIKALQAAVLQKERFSAMGQVVAGVAHEIRNPLFGISSIGQIFERELKNPAHQELVRALLSESRRLSQLVEDLLIYGRPVQLSLTRCDIMALWEDVISLYREELAQKKITVQDDASLGHTVAVLDANQIRQMFLNLLRNAIDAMPGGGQITTSLLLEDRHIIFKLSDTGSGIPQANISKVFDLFFTTKPKGSGLGLAICRKIVEDHGGTITLTSGSGPQAGTTVVVKFPYRPPSEKHRASSGKAQERE